ncbi:hypothetical protein BH24CHL7_BH24CHL7_13880 [soil metagenome]
MDEDRDIVGRRAARDVPRTETVVHEDARVGSARTGSVMDVQTAAAGAVARDPLSWGPIWAGVLTAFGLFLIMSLIALAAGLQAVDLGGAGAGGADVPVNAIAAIITGLFLVVAFFAGGFVSSWSAGLQDEGRGILHGFLVWALFILLLLVFASFGLGSAFGAAGSIFAGDFSPGAVPNVDVDAEQLLEAFQEAAWQTLFAIVLALAAAVLGGLVGTREDFARKWDDYTTRVRP